MMRVYVPTTLAALTVARQQGLLAGPDGAPPSAHAVTGAVREWYVEGDIEELEYSAMIDAAQECLALLVDDPTAPRRRVVVAADVPDATVRPLADGSRSAVALSAPVPLAAAVSVHVDEAGAEPVVDAAVGALPAALAGDDDARFLVDEAEALDLLWYDVTELDDLVRDGRPA